MHVNEKLMHVNEKKDLIHVNEIKDKNNIIYQM